MPVSEAEWHAWYKEELKKGWQDDILIPGFHLGKRGTRGDAVVSDEQIATRVYDLMLDDKIVTTYDTREEADAALAWYVKTRGAPLGTFYVQENHEATI